MILDITEDQWGLISNLLSKNISSLKSYINKRENEMRDGFSVTTARGMEGLKKKEQELFECELLQKELSNQF